MKVDKLFSNTFSQISVPTLQNHVKGGQIDRCMERQTDRQTDFPCALNDIVRFMAPEHKRGFLESFGE